MPKPKLEDDVSEVKKQLQIMNELLFSIARSQAKLAGEQPPSMPKLPPPKARLRDRL